VFTVVRPPNRHAVVGSGSEFGGRTKMKPSSLILIALMGTPSVSTALCQEANSPLNDRERVVHLLSRFTSGVRARDVDRLLEIGIDTWLDEQLDPDLEASEVFSRRLADLQTLEMSPSEIAAFTNLAIPASPTRAERLKRSQRRQIPAKELMKSVVLRSVYSDRQVEEVLCDFWRNHFNVSYTKTYPAHLYITSHEFSVIQSHALGNFGEMLNASAHHPAMMHYLDNALSRRPPSSAELAKLENNIRTKTGSKERGREAAEIAAMRGVNENYARELLELHTLGVDRTYKQKDVVAVAEALTGWGVARGDDGVYGFEFDNERHVKGDMKFLDHVLRADKKKGTSQGDRILVLLAAHNDTAEFVAMKLVRYFVHDEPPSKLIKEVAKTYKKRNGDISSMIRTIIESEEFWERANYQAKFKTPNEFLVSALRVTNAEIENLDDFFGALKAMGQLTYHCDDPTGWYDTADAWLDPGVMAKRWELSQSLASSKIKGIRIPPAFFGEIDEETSALTWMREMVAKVLPGGASSRTLAMLHEIVREHASKRGGADALVLGPQVLGLLLGSPEFQTQ
jgi:uncharacterized protein (DUF1800 family)